MTMVVLYSGLYFSTAFFTFFRIRDKYLSRALYFLLVIAAILLAVFRIPGESPDYSNYVYSYNNINKSWVEYSYKLIAGFIKSNLNNVLYLFAFYAILSITIKGRVFWTFSTFPMLALLTYFSQEYISEECAAMRAGLAVAFMFLSLKPLFEKKFFLFFCYGAAATFFHYQAITFILLPFVFVFNTPKRLFLLFALSIASPFIIAPVMNIVLDLFIHNRILSGIAIDKIKTYTSEAMPVLNTFRFAILYRYAIFLSLLYFSKQIIRHNKYFFYEMAVYAYAGMLNSIFYFSSIISHRLSDMFFAVEIFLLPNLMYVFKSKNEAKLVIFCIVTVKFGYLCYLRTKGFGITAQ